MKKYTWKRLVGGLLSMALLAGLTACGNQETQQNAAAVDNQESQTSGNPQNNAEDATQEPDASGGGETETDGGVLVVYYSATGNTDTVADYIAEATGGDLFESTPAEPYTDEDLNWRNVDSRVTLEHEDPSLQSVELASTTVDGWENYDTIFIGYPIWWGVAAWPVSSFVEANDFTGKTVIPFCTSSSSGLGQSGDLLEETAGSGTWLDGERFRSRAEEADVVDWINRLDLSAAAE